MLRMLKPMVFAALLLAGSISWQTPRAAAQQRPQKLIVGLLPGESPATVLRLNEPLRVYLEKRLGMPVELRVGENYVATGEALQAGRSDIAYLGPVTYILRSRSAKLDAFARPLHAQTGQFFHAAIIVPADSPVKTLADLKGGAVGFGDAASTSGTWVPRYQLLEAGLIPWRDYTPRSFGGHDNVARAVAARIVDAGGLSLTIYNRLLKEGKIDPKSVRVLAQSPAIPEYMWTFREGLDPALKEEISRTFLEVTDPDVLKVFNAKSFVPCAAPDLDLVRSWIETVQAATPAH